MLCHICCAEIFLQFFLNTVFTQISIPQYLCDLDEVVELTISYDPESYTGGSVTAGRVTIARQVKGQEPH